MTARIIDAIPTANTNLAGLGFGAMYPLLAPVLVLMLPSGKTCELLHTSPVVQKMMGYSKTSCDGGHSYRNQKRAMLASR